MANVVSQGIDWWPWCTHGLEQSVHAYMLKAEPPAHICVCYQGLFNISLSRPLLLFLYGSSSHTSIYAVLIVVAHYSFFCAFGYICSHMIFCNFAFVSSGNLCCIKLTIRPARLTNCHGYLTRSTYVFVSSVVSFIIFERSLMSKWFKGVSTGKVTFYIHKI